MWNKIKTFFIAGFVLLAGVCGMLFKKLRSTSDALKKMEHATETRTKAEERTADIAVHTAHDLEKVIENTFEQNKERRDDILTGSDENSNTSSDKTYNAVSGKTYNDIIKGRSRK